MESPRGRGVKESMALKWNFQRECGAHVKKPSVGGVWIFSGKTQCITQLTGNSEGEGGFTIMEFCGHGG